jgi:hypothetical protein
VRRAADLVLPSNDEDAVSVLIGHLLDRHPERPVLPVRRTGRGRSGVPVPKVTRR